MDMVEGEEDMNVRGNRLLIGGFAYMKGRRGLAI